MSAPEPQDLRIYRFHPAGLDPITVYVEQYSERASRVTVQCYAQAWTAYWGAHGDEGAERFMRDCSVGYLVDSFVWGNNGLMLKRREMDQARYLGRIIDAIQRHFAAIANKEAAHA